MSLGPFETRIGILNRLPLYADLVVRNRMGTTAYQVYTANTLNDAYGNLVGSGVAGAGPIARLTADAGQIGQSVSIVRTGRGQDEGNRRGHTSFQFDPEDYALADDAFLFARVQEQRPTGGGWLIVAAGPNAGTAILGPIMIVPSPAVFGMGTMVFGLQGLAPLGTTSTPGVVPHVDLTVTIPLPMHLAFPRPATTVTIRNLDAVETLLISTGLGMPMIRIGPGVQTLLTGGGTVYPGTVELVLAAAVGAVGAVPFAVETTVGMFRNF